VRSTAEESPSQPLLAMTLAVVVATLVLFGLLHQDSEGHWAAYPGAIPGDGLIAAWTFDGAGDSVIDYSGNRNDGVFVNSGLAPGRTDEALDLKGSDDSHASIPATASLGKFTDQITVSAWVFPRERPGGFIVVASRQIGTLQHPDQFYLGYGTAIGLTTYKWHLGTIEDGVVQDASVYAGLASANRWVHLAGVYDGKMLRLYVNGVEIGRHAQTGMIQVDDNPVTIGGEENGSDSRVVDGEFNGLIDDVYIYNRALSPEEIQALYKQSPD